MEVAMTRDHPGAFPLAELFGWPDTNRSKEADSARRNKFCPFLVAECTKKTGHAEAGPIGTCSIRKGQRTIIICPQRFRGDNHTIAREIAGYAFGAGTSFKLVRELAVRTGAGERWSLDYVAAERTATGYGKIIAIEDQAIDTTGSVVPYVQWFLAARSGTVKHSFGLNWANVYKRIIPQVARKGRIFEAWGSQLYVVIQDELLRYIRNRIALSSAQEGEAVNLLFEAYRLEADTAGGINRLTPAETFATTVRRLDEAYQASAALPLRDAVEKLLDSKPAL
jgi:hypothetical protein